MNTNDIPQTHPELLDALQRQDEQARQMKLSEGFTEKVMERVKKDGEKRDGEKKRKREVNNERMKSEKYKLQEPVESNSVTEGNSYFSLFTHSLFTFKKIAAIFLAAAFLSGLAWAIIPHIKSPKTDSPQSTQVTAPSQTGRAEGGSSIRFSDARLDSILSVVAAHYGKAVCFRSEKARAMKLITTWNPTDSLVAFIDHLNMFDCLHLTLKGDTIFVDSVNEEEE